MLLGIVAKPTKRDKFEVTPQSVAYLAALVSVSEEVRGRCHARPPRLRSNNSTGSGAASATGSASGCSDPFSVSDLRLDLQSVGMQNNAAGREGRGAQPAGSAGTTTAGTGSLSPVSNYSTASTALLHTSASHNALSSIQGSALNSPVSSGSNNSSTTHLLVPVGSGSCSSQTALIPSLVDSDSPPPGRRQTSWDLLDQNAIQQAKMQQKQQQQQQQQMQPQPCNQQSTGQQQNQQLSGVESCGAKALFKTQRSFSVPTTRDQRSLERNSQKGGDRSQSPSGSGTTPTPPTSCSRRPDRGSVSGESNCLLDPEILTNSPTQALVLTVLATLVKYTTDENEMRVLYEYLAEASVVFPRVFPIIHSLLDAKITNVLSLCHDQGILAAVQSIIQNMIALEGTAGEQQQQLHYLQSCGFGGLWRFAGPFTKSNCTAESAELFVNCLEALVETCLPAEEGESDLAPFPSMLSVSSNMNLSSSLSSITLGSPTDKAK